METANQRLSNTQLEILKAFAIEERLNERYHMLDDLVGTLQRIQL